MVASFIDKKNVISIRLKIILSFFYTLQINRGSELLRSFLLISERKKRMMTGDIGKLLAKENLILNWYFLLEVSIAVRPDPTFKNFFNLNRKDTLTVLRA